MHVAGDIAAFVRASELSPFNRAMAWVGSAGPADFTKNGLSSLFASGFLRECATSADIAQQSEDKEDLLYAAQSHAEWIRWQIKQEKNSLVFGCLGPEAPWRSCSPSAAGASRASISQSAAAASRASSSPKAAFETDQGHIFEEVQFFEADLDQVFEAAQGR